MNSDSSKLIRRFPFKTPTLAVVVTTGLTLGVCGILAYVSYIQNQFPVWIIGLVSLIAIIINIWYIKNSLKIKFIELYLDRIVVPYRTKYLQIAIDEIFSVREFNRNGHLILIIDRKRAGSIELPMINMNELDFYDLQEMLDKLVPKQLELTPYQKRKKRIAQASLTLIGVVFLFVILKNGLNGEVAERLLAIPIIAVITIPLGIVVSKIQEFQKTNRVRLNEPSIKRRRSLLNWTLGFYFTLIFGLAFYFMMPDNRIESDSAIIYPAVAFSILFYACIDHIQKLKEFLSIWERGLYAGSFLLFGTLTFLFYGPYLVKSLYSQTEIKKTAKLKIQSNKKGSTIFTIDIDAFMDPEFFKHKYPNASENDIVTYTEYQNASGIKIFGNYQIRKN